jgi:hypothetical protein
MRRISKVSGIPDPGAPRFETATGMQALAIFILRVSQAL